MTGNPGSDSDAGHILTGLKNDTRPFMPQGEWKGLGLRRDQVARSIEEGHIRSAQSHIGNADQNLVRTASRRFGIYDIWSKVRGPKHRLLHTIPSNRIAWLP
ncbi:hypothetical protein GCM10027570_14020 [Streptomonospora sediminis]